MRLLSSAIQEGQPIPPRFTCEGENISPEFYGVNAPKETKSFVLILHDPDAPLRATTVSHTGFSMTHLRRG
jgi:phosphatidylethanolamine-binding protein (PEBP) family uncharacterized protein